MRGREKNRILALSEGKMSFKGEIRSAYALLREN
jgi:hypothetical protein